LRSERPIPRQVVRPIESFIRTEAGSGVLLLAAALAALAWANVEGSSYEDFWTTAVTVELGSLSLEEDLRHLVNDLLMAIFFYVVALEVKREFLLGSLRERGAATVPVAAALGTMVGAALTYVAVNLGGGDLEGWAIPIATDIAFALAVLGVAGHRATREVRAFLLTLAVVDDLGTIAVIAFFFGEGISFAWLGGAAGAVVAVLALQRVGVRLLAPYVALAAILWLAVFESGVHATIAGVVLGFLTPARPFYPSKEAGKVIASQLEQFDRDPDVEIGAATMHETSRLTREAVSPLTRMETAFHPWSAFVVLPLFGLANAGVPVSAAELGDVFTSSIGLGILLGLVVGAPVVGVLMSWSVVRVSRATMPANLDWAAIVAVAPLKGIGFTVAIFIATLAFDDPAKIDQAKLAILVASALAAVIGFTALAVRHRTMRKGGTESEPNKPD
jgi:NhaA family Na+:H+ antiporter